MKLGDDNWSHKEDLLYGDEDDLLLSQKTYILKASFYSNNPSLKTTVFPVKFVLEKNEINKKRPGWQIKKALNPPPLVVLNPCSRPGHCELCQAKSV